MEDKKEKRAHYLYQRNRCEIRARIKALDSAIKTLNDALDNNWMLNTAVVKAVVRVSICERAFLEHLLKESSDHQTDTNTDPFTPLKGTQQDPTVDECKTI